MLHRNFLMGLMLLAGTAAAAPRLSDTEALKFLERVARAPTITSFQGVYVQQHGEHIESVGICHVVEGGVVSERREMLDGPPREMIRHGDQVSAYFAEGSRLKSFDPRNNGRLFPRLLPDNPAEILLNYNLRRVGRERVAGVEAEIIDLEPRDRMRYPHRLWAHVDSGLLLKAATLGFKQEVYDLYAFSQLQIGNHVDRSKLKPVYPVQPLSAEKPVTASAALAAQWDAKTVPSGFRMIQQSQRTLSGRTQPVLHHLYSDGITTVSVFVEQVTATEAKGGAMRQGALSVYGWRDGNFRITALGEVPPETVELFAKAYRLIEKPAEK